MSMPDSGRRSPTYTGTGQVREFAFNFKVFSQDQVKVYTQAAEGAPVEELASSNYSVALQDAGGTVSLNTPLADQAKLVIVSAIPYDQEVSLENFGSFNPEDLNGAWDKNTALIQQVREELKRAVKVPLMSDTDPEGVIEDLIAVGESVGPVIPVLDEIKTVAGIAPEVVKTAGMEDAVKTVGENIEDVSVVSKGFDTFTDMGDIDLGRTTDPVEGQTVADGVLPAIAKNIGAIVEVHENLDELVGQGGAVAAAEKAVEAAARAEDAADRAEAQANAVSYLEQELTQEQKTQAKKNIGADYFVNVKDFGAKGDGVTDDTEAFIAAGTAGPVYVPEGTYLLSNPYDLVAVDRFFGPGVLRFSIAEQRRRGGSSGGEGIRERYTLVYRYEKKDDVRVTFNGTPQSFTWVDDTTVEAPGTSFGADVRIEIVNGFRHLPSVPEMIGAFSTFASDGGRNCEFEQTPGSAGVGGNNVALGSFSLRDVTTGKNNTAFGSLSLLSLKTGENNTAVGYNTLYRSNGSQNTAVGSIAGEWITTGSGNTLCGALAGKHLTTAENSTAIGYDALGEDRSGALNTAVGYRALGNTGTNQSLQMSTAVGAFAGDFAHGNYNTFLGYRAGNGDSENFSDGSENVAIGYMALRNHKGADKNTVIGTSAGLNIAGQQENTVAGYNAGTDITGNKAVAVGSHAGKKAGSGTVAIGNAAARVCEGTNCVVIGNTAGINLTTGQSNTFVGANSGRFDYSGTPTEVVSNCTAIGENARVDGDNQVQLGNSATTVYAYGTVQSRSDARDKADVRDTVLGLNFITKLRPVDFRWDYRDDYVETAIEGENEDGTPIVRIIRHEKDGSKKRTRYHHGLIAQEVKAVADSLGVDFGGYQDHLVKDGGDVKTIGYEELIAPLIKAVQELSQRLTEVEKRLLDKGE